MDGRVPHLWFVVFFASSCRAASDSLVVLVGTPISVQRSHTTTLPCWLNPPQSAEDLEVRWYRGDQFDNPIILYRAKKVENATQEASYAGRVSFGLESNRLKSGDVSLELRNAKIEDAGDYICYVSSYQGYDSATISLLVTETGTSPQLSPVWMEDNRVNVSCESEGWYPQPVLRWSDQKQDVTTGTVVFGKGSSGLVSVRSWALVKSSSEVSCSVGLPNTAAKEARMSLKDAPQPAERESGSSTAGWVAFALLLVATVLAVLAAMYIRKKGKKSKSDVEQADENDSLLQKDKVQPSVLSGLHKYYENIKLEDTNNKFLTIKDTLLRDGVNAQFPDGQSVTCLTAIKGTPGFSSGQHYWEVSLGKPVPGLKHSWWVGVTSASKIDQELVSPNTANGFWFLSSSPNRADRFQVNTEPEVFIGCRRPQTIGVFLDCDDGELSFYNVEDQTLIGSLKAKFTGEVFPLFNPGKGDKAPMKILHKEEANQSGDESGVSDAQETEP